MRSFVNQQVEVDVRFVFLCEILKGMRFGHTLGALADGLAVHLRGPLRCKPRGVDLLNTPELELVRRNARLVLHHRRQRLQERRQELRDARSRLFRRKQSARSEHVQRLAQ